MNSLAYTPDQKLPHVGTALPHELPEIVERLAPSLEVLSLDCFDTLLWRRTCLPTDVFYDLQNEAEFRTLGLSAKLRRDSEARARATTYVRSGHHEVTLADIYGTFGPTLDDEALARLQELELEAEVRACFALPATVEAIRKAKAAGLRVVIVSDTYLTRSQLEQLLDRSLPGDVRGAIERVFCSSEYRRSKSGGLLEDVRRELQVTAGKILHVGDNEHADFVSAKRLGAHAVHLNQYTRETKELLRLNAAALGTLDPRVRHERSLPSPYHGLLSSQERERTPAERLGYSGVGPVLYAFGQFVLSEIDELRKSSARVKPLFLLRDAHLPHRVCQAIAGQPVGQECAISRFASIAASFRSQADVESYLARSAGSSRLESLAKQLLLPETRAKQLVQKARKSRDPAREFVAQVLRPSVVQTIVSASAEYRKRFYRYLTYHLGVERGDTLVFVDLGYEGTAQRQLQEMLEQDLGVQLVGRYLLVSATAGWQNTRKGLFDPSWCDDRALATVVPYVALLEDVCTCAQGSVVDYDQDGNPIRAGHVIDPEQFVRIEPVQEETVGFARDATSFFELVGEPDPSDSRSYALGALARLLFFPSAEEISFLEGFRLDMNLATLDSFALFDREAGLRGLRQRGLFFMERDLGSLRMNYPIELRSAGLELGLTLMTQHRYTLEFTHDDLSMRQELVKVLVVQGASNALSEMNALATHDGYFSLTVPVGARNLDIGVLLGVNYSWVEIESVHLIKASALLSDQESANTEVIDQFVMFEGITRHGRRVCECRNAESFVFISPGRLPSTQKTPSTERYVVRLVFRPLERRTVEEQSAVTAH